MAYNDNRDILKWKRSIDSIQSNEQPVDEPIVDEDQEQMREETIGQDEQGYISTEHYEIIVSVNELGIIVDVKDKNDNEIDSNQYWDEDAMGESTETEESSE